MAFSLQVWVSSTAMRAPARRAFGQQPVHQRAAQAPAAVGFLQHAQVADAVAVVPAFGEPSPMAASRCPSKAAKAAGASSQLPNSRSVKDFSAGGAMGRWVRAKPLSEGEISR